MGGPAAADAPEEAGRGIARRAWRDWQTNTGSGEKRAVFSRIWGGFKKE
jgi:hypothetical protein